MKSQKFIPQNFPAIQYTVAFEGSVRKATIHRHNNLVTFTTFWGAKGAPILFSEIGFYMASCSYIYTVQVAINHTNLK